MSRLAITTLLVVTMSSAVAHADEPEPTPAPQLPSTGEPAGEPPPARPPSADFSVQITADEPVWLEREEVENRRWTRVCDAPCRGTSLSSQGRYRVRGDGIRATRPIEVAPGTQSTLDVHTRGTGTFVGGFVTIGVGALTLAVGSALWISTFSLGDLTAEQERRADIGGGLVIAGIAIAAIGAIVVATSARSSLDQSSAAVSATAPPMHGGRREERSRRGSITPTPATLEVPLFTTTF